MKKSILIFFLLLITNLIYGQGNENHLSGLDGEIETFLNELIDSINDLSIIIHN
jgi:hypothetical protein